MVCLSVSVSIPDEMLNTIRKKWGLSATQVLCDGYKCIVDKHFEKIAQFQVERALLENNIRKLQERLIEELDKGKK